MLSSQLGQSRSFCNGMRGRLGVAFMPHLPVVAHAQVRDDRGLSLLAIAAEHDFVPVSLLELVMSSWSGTISLSDSTSHLKRGARTD